MTRLLDGCRRPDPLVVGVVAQQSAALPNCQGEYDPRPRSRRSSATPSTGAPRSSSTRAAAVQRNNHRGRFAIHEMMPMHRELIRLTLSGLRPCDRQGFEAGWSPCKGAAPRIGRTTVEEVLRVAYSSSGRQFQEITPAKSFAAVTGAKVEGRRPHWPTSGGPLHRRRRPGRPAAPNPAAACFPPRRRRKQRRSEVIPTTRPDQHGFGGPIAARPGVDHLRLHRDQQRHRRSAK